MDIVLPHNEQAEAAVLGSMMIDEACKETALSILAAEQFYFGFHRKVFTAIKELAIRGEPADIIIVKQELERTKSLDAAGIIKLSVLTDGIPRSMNIEHYAKIVIENSKLRKLIVKAHEIVKSASSGEDVSTIISNAEQSIFQLAHDHGEKSSLEHVTEAARDAILSMGVAQQGKRELAISGLQELDENLLGGFTPNSLTYLAGRPGTGKTALALQIGYASANAGKRVAIFSVEMARGPLAMRLFSSLAGVDGKRIRMGQLSSGEKVLIEAACGQVERLPMWIDQSPDIGIFDIVSRCRRKKSDGGLDLVIVDYIQLMRFGKAENHERQLSETSRGFKLLIAKDLDIPVIVLSQLSRASEMRSDKRPQLSDLRGCGGMEQDADIVLFTFRPTIDETEIIIGKQRDGPVGTVLVHFDGSTQRFTDRTAWKEEGKDEVPVLQDGDVQQAVVESA